LDSQENIPQDVIPSPLEFIPYSELMNKNDLEELPFNVQPMYIHFAQIFMYQRRLAESLVKMMKSTVKCVNEREVRVINVSRALDASCGSFTFYCK